VEEDVSVAEFEVTREPEALRETKVTLHDVASLAGVSARTVSRVVNDEGGFGPDVRARVLAAIDQTGYLPNRLARALITRRTGIVGLMMPNVTDPYFAELADEFQTVAQGRGLNLLFAQHRNDLPTVNAILDTLASFAVDGLIMYSAVGNVDAMLKHSSQGLPIVLIDQELQSPNVASLYSTIQQGAVDAVTHLITQGRTEIVMIGNRQSTLSPLPPRREAGYRSALAVGGIEFDPSRLIHDEPTIEGGRRAVEYLIANGVSFDAVFAYNDLVAVGAMQALAAAQRTVPGDVAIVGFDDILLCAALVPALTSVRMNRQVGTCAFEALEALRLSPRSSPPPFPLGTELVVRASTA
jgi:DNA-binding LacI/PurR family transcriptional regulator